MPQQTKQCPYCAEEILAAAIKCKHCGEMLNRVHDEITAPTAVVRDSAEERRRRVAEFFRMSPWQAYVLAAFPWLVAVGMLGSAASNRAGNNFNDTFASQLRVGVMFAVLATSVLVLPLGWSFTREWGRLARQRFGRIWDVGWVALVSSTLAYVLVEVVDGLFLRGGRRGSYFLDADGIAVVALLSLLCVTTSVWAANSASRRQDA